MARCPRTGPRGHPAHRVHAAQCEPAVSSRGEEGCGQQPPSPARRAGLMHASFEE
jgi:hypothetical protein